MMLQPSVIHDSEISCDTTSVFTTPFSVKDILCMQVSNEPDYCCNNGVKKEPFEVHPQLWDNSLYNTNDFNYCSSSGGDRHYWNNDNFYSETYPHQYHQSPQQNASPTQIPTKDDIYIQTESPSKWKHFYKGVHLFNEFLWESF